MDLFPGTHLHHTAIRGVSGAEAQSPMPAVHLPVLSVLQVSRDIWSIGHVGHCSFTFTLKLFILWPAWLLYMCSLIPEN